MALLDATLPAQRFQIDAFDVSERALESARRAVYGRRSFRGADLTFRDRYFRPGEGGYELAATVRQAVRFHQRNLLMPTLVDEADRYDVIFCRNLLIYFDRPTQDRAISVLGRLLVPGGMLFVGPSETGVMLAHDFHSARLPMAFAFRRGAAPLERRHLPAPLPAKPAAPQPVMPPLPARIPFAKAPTPGARPSAEDKPSPTLEAAQRLADEGRFAEAIKTCEEFLRQHSASAPGHYLLGLVHDAAGNVKTAEAWYRKTLYLDPEHDGALAHLALLMDTQGRAADAQLLRKRVQRVTQKKAT
jgi:chemotaxis protein methyltransferase WspC